MSCKNVMQDCRAFTNYEPNCALNEYIQMKYGINNSTAYRLFLQRNGAELQQLMQKKTEFQNATGCNCVKAHPPHDEEVNPVPYDANKNEKVMKYHPLPNAPGKGRWNMHGGKMCY